MIAFDTTFLVDYLDEVDATVAYLQAHEERPLVTTSLSLFEVYRGALRSDGPERVATVAEALEWVDPLPLDDPAAKEAARIEADLRNAGTPVNLVDVLVAGICRLNGATLVTRDDHFDDVPELTVDRY